jgi:hypothetical protein
MQYWLPDVNVVAWIIMTLVIITVLNVFHVKFFGEAEFVSCPEGAQLMQSTLPRSRSCSSSAS